MGYGLNSLLSRFIGYWKDEAFHQMCHGVSRASGDYQLICTFCGKNSEPIAVFVCSAKCAIDTISDFLVHHHWSSGTDGVVKM
jgi:hypothetical protein